MEWETDLLRSMVLDVNSSNAVISNTDCEMATPSSIISLVEKIHPIVRGTNVADIGCGTGTYLTSAFLNQPNASYYGYEINSDSKVVASIRATLLGHNVHIDQCDAFCLVNDQSIALLPPSKFDFIFSNYPFAMKVGTVLQNAGVQKLLTLYPMLSKATSADWLFNALIMELLAPEGEAICVTTNGSTWRLCIKRVTRALTKSPIEFIHLQWIVLDNHFSL